jgi:hypothetical protein
VTKKLRLELAGSMIMNYKNAFKRVYLQDCTLSDQEVLDIYNSDDTNEDLTNEEFDALSIYDSEELPLTLKDEPIQDRWMIHDMFALQSQKLMRKE